MLSPRRWLALYLSLKAAYRLHYQRLFGSEEETQQDPGGSEQIRDTPQPSHKCLSRRDFILWLNKPTAFPSTHTSPIFQVRNTHAGNTLCTQEPHKQPSLATLVHCCGRDRRNSRRDACGADSSQIFPRASACVGPHSVLFAPGFPSVLWDQVWNLILVHPCDPVTLSSPSLSLVQLHTKTFQNSGMMMEHVRNLKNKYLKIRNTFWVKRDKGHFKPFAVSCDHFT